MNEEIKISARNLNLYYGENHALKDINMDIKKNAVTALIGPSGCGKSTFLKSLNRMNDLAADAEKLGGRSWSRCNRRQYTSYTVSVPSAS